MSADSSRMNSEQSISSLFNCFSIRCLANVMLACLSCLNSSISNTFVLVIASYVFCLDFTCDDNPLLIHLQVELKIGKLTVFDLPFVFA